MHRAFRRALANAVGDSVNVLVTFVDIRDFSKWSKTVQSVESALFLKKAYAIILDRYFPNADFYKPTGDGLMIIHELPFDTSNDQLKDAAAKLLDASLRLLDAFPSLLASEAAITFSTPPRLGIGLALGAACKLKSGNLVLDYSGSVLNLAARLMDYARPEGLVLDSKLGFDLLDGDTRNKFVPDEVFVRGITEDAPSKVYALKDRTSIPASAHHSPDEAWEDVSIYWKTVKDVVQAGALYVLKLPTRPLHDKEIELRVRHPTAMPGGRKHPVLWSTHRHKVEYDDTFNANQVRIYPPKVLESIRTQGAKDPWPVQALVRYRSR